MEENEKIFSSEDKINDKKNFKEFVNYVKNISVKNDVKYTKDFFKDFLQNPIDLLKKVIDDSKNKFLKIAIFILIIWLIAIFLKSIFSIANTYLFSYLGNFSYFFNHIVSNILSIFKNLVAPFISVLALSIIIYCFNKNENKSFLQIATTVLITKIPVVISVIVSLLSVIDTQLSKLILTFSSYCSVLSSILLFFSIRFLFKEEKYSVCFKKFALIMGIFYIIKLVFSYLGIIF